MLQCDGSCVPHEDDDLDGSEQADDDDHPDDNARPDDEGDDDDARPDDRRAMAARTRLPAPVGTAGRSRLWRFWWLRRSGPQPGVPPTGQARERRPADLIVPLGTLLGLSERPGEIHGFGLLDPSLARQLAAAAAASPRTEVCVTVTSPEGYAIGHGCARPARTSRPVGSEASPIALPARLNLTIPAAALPGLCARPAHGSWSFARGRRSPDLRRLRHLDARAARRARFTVRLDPVPVFECDHRYETHGYRPSDRLRHLVQIRDGTCTFPPCNRHARESDFEHAKPYGQGGKTCTCNAGARSRACHRVKQSPGWNVTQPRPGWHRWQTPAGHVYVQEPKRYPA